jgi:segregation and condensation protein B
VLRHLIEQELIRVAGREEGLGRALLYGTTRQFLDRFGLKSVKDLPASLEL